MTIKSFLIKTSFVGLVATTLFTGVNSACAEEGNNGNGQIGNNKDFVYGQAKKIEGEAVAPTIEMNMLTFSDMREEYYQFLVNSNISVEQLSEITFGYTPAFLSISGGSTADGSWVDGVFKYTGDTIYQFAIRGQKPYTNEEVEKIKQFIETKFNAQLTWTEVSTQSDGKGWVNVGFNLNNDPLKYLDKVQ